MKAFHLTVARVGETLFEGEVISCEAPGVDGIFTVYAEHEPFVSTLAKGVVRIKTADGTHKDIQIEEQGLAEVSEHQATILV